MMTTSIAQRPQKIVQPIAARVASHTSVKTRKDGSAYISYCFRCDDGQERWKSLDSDDYLPMGTRVQLVPYWVLEGKKTQRLVEHHQIVVLSGDATEPEPEPDLSWLDHY